jgi:succinate dehydrogenase/fumarate reductase flavoprotein subunit
MAVGIDEAELARRTTLGIAGKGVGVIAALALTARELGVQMLAGRRASRLTTRDGAVTGVEADGDVFAGTVVLATGGFERDPALVKAFLRGPMTAPGSPPTNEGDGLRMGMSVGAELGNMSEAWWAPATSGPGWTVDGAPFHFLLLGAVRAAPGGIIVDSRGRRYADEAANYNDFGRSMHEFDPAGYAFPRATSWLVFDAGRRHALPIGPVGPSDPDPDWLPRADTLAELATRIDVPPRTLMDTVERYNTHAALGQDQDFGRGNYAWDAFSTNFLPVADQLRPLTEAPFYALRVSIGCLGTKGGLRIDGDARVRRADGRGVIPGLHAAGNAAANPFGTAYPSGGATVGPALVFGWLAGQAAAAG